MAIPSNNSKCLDIGGFWGVFPTTLADLGMNVNMTEAKKYYDSSFNQIFEFIEGKNVVIHDIDPFEENLSGSYDFISVMAVLEHIPFSLKYFMSNVKSVMAEPCTLYVDVPNIAYYFKRRDLAMGKTPLPGILSIYNSEKPFIGHHHEFTMKELVDLFKMEELHVDKVDSFNYSIKPSARFALSNPLAFVCLQFFPGMREVISIQARNKV
jgi:2-polyprenyl-3-methyl-5-hydroxy-6-metoxy-1,4-benzoquinol methylase